MPWQFLLLSVGHIPVLLRQVKGAGVDSKTLACNLLHRCSDLGTGSLIVLSCWEPKRSTCQALPRIPNPIIPVIPQLD